MGWLTRLSVGLMATFAGVRLGSRVCVWYGGTESYSPRTSTRRRLAGCVDCHFFCSVFRLLFSIDCRLEPTPGVVFPVLTLPAFCSCMRASVLVRCLGIRQVKDVWTNESASFALSKSGLLFSWGNGQAGQLGTGVFIDTVVPQFVRPGQSGVDMFDQVGVTC